GQPADVPLAGRRRRKRLRIPAIALGEFRQTDLGNRVGHVLPPFAAARSGDMALADPSRQRRLGSVVVSYRSVATQVGGALGRRGARQDPAGSPTNLSSTRGSVAISYRRRRTHARLREG